MHRNREKRRFRASAATCALTLALVAIALPAEAQMDPGSDEIAGTVLSIDDGEMVLDLGVGQGLEAGTSVEIWRPLRLKHPVTGRVFTDRFRLGTIVVDQVLSRCRSRTRRASSRALRSAATSSLRRSLPHVRPSRDLRPYGFRRFHLRLHLRLHLHLRRHLHLGRRRRRRAGSRPSSR